VDDKFPGRRNAGSIKINMTDLQKLTPSLWFEDNCEEAMNLYVETFNGNPNKKSESKIISIKRYEEGMQTPGNDQMIGKVLTGIFELEGMQFMALDGGPVFKMNEAISFQIMCADQAEVDYFTDKLSAVPGSEVCGWTKDKYGLSWQIIPKRLPELLEKDTNHKVINAMLQMKKIDIAKLEEAFEDK
jgi:predicted 3-demethylubiquinone-9 3-methyltransferase (glyoxalase superfamily)